MTQDKLPVLVLTPDKVTAIWLAPGVPGWLIVVPDGEPWRISREFVVVGEEEQGIRQGLACRIVRPGLYSQQINKIEPIGGTDRLRAPFCYSKSTP